VVGGSGTSTERQIVTACLGLLVVSLLPTLVGLAGPIYFLGALICGLGLSALGVLQALEPTAKAARRVLLASLLYLPAILALLALDKA
jgi:protoheme IX farnesyltransferase